jgi:hypothetical protein
VHLIGRTLMSWDKNHRDELASRLNGAPATIRPGLFGKWDWTGRVAAKITPRRASAVVTGNTTLGKVLGVLLTTDDAMILRASQVSC